MIPQIRGGFKKSAVNIFNILDIKNGGKIHRSFHSGMLIIQQLKYDKR